MALRMPGGSHGVDSFDCTGSEGKRYFRTENRQRPPVARPGPKSVRNKHHGWNTDAATDQQDVGPLGRRDEGLSDRPEQVNAFTRGLARQQSQAVSDYLVENFDPVVACTHYRHRATHQQRLVATEVHKVPGFCGLRALRRPHSHDKLFGSESLHRDQFAILDVQRAAILLRGALRRSDHRSAMMRLTRSSTAIRTATPLRYLLSDH